MHDIVIIASIVSGVTAFTALGVAAWHTWKIELHRHHSDSGTGTDKPG